MTVSVILCFLLQLASKASDLKEIDTLCFYRVFFAPEPEFLYVLEGKLTIMIDKEEHVLNPYDCIFLDSTTPHNWVDKTDSIVKFLCVSSIPV
ncbi:cupin domain-containing protein [Bacillus cereus]|uniref:cupin domain-containing protein n=1 Tax=Bacillus cereus TaxID=1396 RepID=UPI0020D2806C|nr:cupin domain-containing protein [Bacillus cereus]